MSRYKIKLCSDCKHGQDAYWRCSLFKTYFEQKCKDKNMEHWKKYRPLEKFTTEELMAELKIRGKVRED